MKRIQKNSILKMSARSFLRRHLLMLVIVSSLIGMTLLPFQIFYLSSGELASKSRDHETIDGTNNANRMVNNHKGDVVAQKNIRLQQVVNQEQEQEQPVSKSTKSTKANEQSDSQVVTIKGKKNEKCIFPDELIPIWRLFDGEEDECFPFRSIENTHIAFNNMKKDEKETSCVREITLRTLDQATVYFIEDDLMIENDVVFTSASTMCRFPERKISRSHKPKSKSSDRVYQYSLRDEIDEAVLILADPDDEGAEIYMLSAVRRLLDSNQNMIVLLQASTFRTKAWYDLLSFQPEISYRLRTLAGTEHVKKLHLAKFSGFCGRASSECKLGFRKWLLELVKAVRLDFMLQEFGSGPSLCLLYRSDSACAFPGEEQGEEDNNEDDEKETCRGLSAALTRDLRSKHFMPNLQVNHILTDGTGFGSATEAMEIVSRVSTCDAFISLNELPLFHEVLYKSSSRVLRFGLAGDVLEDSFENNIEHDLVLDWELNYSLFFPKTKQELFQAARKFVQGNVIVPNTFHDYTKPCARSSSDKFQPYSLVKDNDCFPISEKLERLKQSSKSSSMEANWMDHFIIKAGVQFAFDLQKEGEQWWDRYNKNEQSQHVLTRQIDHVTIYPVATISKEGARRDEVDEKRFHHIQSDSLWTSLDVCVDPNSNSFKEESSRVQANKQQQVNRWIDEAVALSSSQLFGTSAVSKNTLINRRSSE